LILFWLGKRWHSGCGVSAPQSNFLLCWVANQIEDRIMNTLRTGGAPFLPGIVFVPILANRVSHFREPWPVLKCPPVAGFQPPGDNKILIPKRTPFWTPNALRLITKNSCGIVLNS
jgi:hypothetical protein